MSYGSRLAANIAAEGGIHTMVFTHIDEICDHAKWKEYFPDLQRVIHRLDVNAESKHFEIVLDGTKADQWEVDEDIHIFHTSVSGFGGLVIIEGIPRYFLLITHILLFFPVKTKEFLRLNFTTCCCCCCVILYN